MLYLLHLPQKVICKSKSGWILFYYFILFLWSDYFILMVCFFTADFRAARCVCSAQHIFGPYHTMVHTVIAEALTEHPEKCISASFAIFVWLAIGVKEKNAKGNTIACFRQVRFYNGITQSPIALWLHMWCWKCCALWLQTCTLSSHHIEICLKIRYIWNIWHNLQDTLDKAACVSSISQSRSQVA